MIDIYTDGSCLEAIREAQEDGRPLVVEGGRQADSLRKRAPNTTKQSHGGDGGHRGDWKLFQEGSSVTVHSDSRYLVNTMNLRTINAISHTWTCGERLDSLVAARRVALELGARAMTDHLAERGGRQHS